MDFSVEDLGALVPLLPSPSAAPLEPLVVATAEFGLCSAMTST